MSQNEILVRLGVRRGAVLHSYAFDGIGHGKFFVVMGVDGDEVAGFFFINSRIHPILENKPEQFAMQYLLRKADYSFLHHDSFVCASDLLEKRVSSFAGEFERGETELVDNLKDEHLREILESVRGSRLFSENTKRRFFRE